MIHPPLLAALAVLLTGTAVFADCGITAGSVSILSNDFEALHVVADAAAECASDTVTVTSNQTAEHANLQGPALTTNPATYSVAMVANDSIVPLLNDGLIRPLDDLVAKYGADLAPTQLIRIDGQVMAIAFMANAQHLYFRKDVLEQVGLDVPKSYEDVLAAAEAIRAAGIADTPLAANFKPGWDLAAEFVNMYLGHGGELFVPGTAELAISNQQAMDALTMMKALSGYMSPDFLTYNTNAMKPLWDSSTAVLLNGWGSRAAGMIDPAQTTPDIAANTGFASAPTVGGGTIPASTLWWDGFVIAKNISDADAEASFRAMIHGASSQTAIDHAAAAVWLMPGYTPTPAAVGVTETIAAGARPYPMAPFMGVLHAALGDNLADFMQGKESAEQALADVTTAYNTAAREAGFLE